MRPQALLVSLPISSGVPQGTNEPKKRQYTGYERYPTKILRPVDRANCDLDSYAIILRSDTAESICRVGRLRKPDQQQLVPRPGLGSAIMDVYDVAHGSLSAAELDDLWSRLSALGHEPDWLSSDQPLVSCRQCDFFLLPLPPCPRNRLAEGGGSGALAAQR